MSTSRRPTPRGNATQARCRCWTPARVRAGPPEGLAAQALALKELDRFDEALEAANRAVMVAPETPEPITRWARSIKRWASSSRRSPPIERAAALPGPAQMDAIANVGALYMEFGRKAEALKAMEAAAETFPDAPGVLHAQVDLRRFEAGDPLIGKMQALLAREGLSLSDRVALHFGLGKAYLDIGDSAEAFHHYDTGNRLKRPTFTYDPDAAARWMARIAEAFSPDAARRQGGRGRALGDAGVRRRHAALRHHAGRADSGFASAGSRRGGTAARSMRWRTDRGLPGIRCRGWSGTQLKAIGEAYLARMCADGAGAAACGRQDAVELPVCRADPADPAGRKDHPQPARRRWILACPATRKLFAGEQPFTYDQTELGQFHVGLPDADGALARGAAGVAFPGGGLRGGGG